MNLGLIKVHTQNLPEEYREVFPKVDPAILYDIIPRLPKILHLSIPWKCSQLEDFTQKYRGTILQTTVRFLPCMTIVRTMLQLII